jgi:hypothetical protein
MSEIEPILIGKGDNLQFLLPSFGNRHGLITGATGTGKTVTLLDLADIQRVDFSGRGVINVLPAQHEHHAGAGNHARDTGCDQEELITRNFIFVAFLQQGQQSGGLLCLRGYQ